VYAFVFNTMELSLVQEELVKLGTGATRNRQAELADSNIKVQLVAPAGTATEGWDSTTVDPSIVMTAEDCVDASLKGLDIQEPTTLPSVEDLQLLANYESAAGALIGASQTGKQARRYTK